MGRDFGGWTGRGPYQRSCWHTFALKGPPTSKWSWRPPSAVVQAPMRGGMRGGGAGRRPCAGWVCRLDGSLSGVAGCRSQWRPTMVKPHTISSWQTTWSYRGPVAEWAWSESGGLYPSRTYSRESCWLSSCGQRMWVQKKFSRRGEMQKPPPSRVQTATDEMKGGGEETARLPGGGGPQRSGESPVRSGDARVPDVPVAFADVQGRPGSERAG